MITRRALVEALVGVPFVPVPAVTPQTFEPIRQVCACGHPLAVQRLTDVHPTLSPIQMACARCRKAYRLVCWRVTS